MQTRAGEDKNIDLFIVPHICESLTTQPIDKYLELYPHISGLDLADDPLAETHEIDVLIGVDFYWEFVTGEMVRGVEGPIAINTTLGWMLSGPADLTGPQGGTIVNFITTHTLRVDDARRHYEIVLGTGIPWDPN